MFRFKNKIIVLLSLLKGLSERDKELINKLKNQEVIWTCYKDFNLLEKYYFINLHSSKANCYKNYEHRFKGNEETCMEINNDRDLNNLIYFLKEEKLLNIYIVFKFEDRKELFKFIKSLRHRLFENKIDKVNICYRENDKVKDFYKSFFSHVETYKDKLVIMRKIHFSNDNYLERLTISNECVLDLMEDYFSLYFGNLNGSNEEILIRKYFFNQKLLFIDVNAIKEEGILLHKELTDLEKELKSMEFIRNFNVLFYFLVDSGCFKNMIRKALDFRELEYSQVLRHVLKNLNIHIFDGRDILSSIGKCIIPAEENINLYLVDDIINRIRMLNVKNDVENYVRLLACFYNYMKIYDIIDIDQLIEIIDILIFKKSLDRKNKKIFKRLIQYINIINNQEINAYISDIHHHQELVFLD